MKHVRKFLSQGNDRTTPSGLAVALYDSGGLKKFNSELVHISTTQILNTERKSMNHIKRIYSGLDTTTSVYMRNDQKMWKRLGSRAFGFRRSSGIGAVSLIASRFVFLSYTKKFTIILSVVTGL